jgi:hypothetical protein
MAKKKAAAKTPDAPKAPAAPDEKEVESKKLESPISTTGAVPTYRLDMGEALP